MPSSSSGLGRCPLKAEITGSNPVGGILGILLPALLLLTGLSSFSIASPKVLSHFTVRLIISADESLKSIVSNDMTRELKKLGDVDVTEDTTASWLLYINVSPIMDAKGLKGYVFSTVIADQYSANTLKDLPAEDFKDPKVAETIKNLIKNQVNLRDHLVQTCKTEDLQKTYAGIVAYFDENYLMPVREDLNNFELMRRRN
jgi:hypothetical protein